MFGRFHPDFAGVLGQCNDIFLIDKMGKIAQIWSSVKVNGHVEEVLKELGKLASK
jgi:peroxiredoxin